MERELQEMTNSSETHVGIRFGLDHLKDIINNGRFKSQFETGDSGGILDNSLRADVEYDEMGYSIKGTAPKARPIYGMLFEGKTSADINVSSSDGGWYGNVVAVMKPSVKQYATFDLLSDTMDKTDSFDPYYLKNTPQFSGFGYRMLYKLDEKSSLKDCFTALTFLVRNEKNHSGGFRLAVNYGVVYRVLGYVCDKL